MIWTRTPCRLSFLGGGTDLPAFFTNEEGGVLSATINRYVYVGIRQGNDASHRMRHDGIEVVTAVPDLRNPILRDVLSRYESHRDSKSGGWDVTSISDVPAGTGLGSSSSFTVGLIHAVRRYLKLSTMPESLAEEAVQTEVFRIASAAGKQDQYCAAFGGFLFLKFLPSGQVVTERLSVSPTMFSELASSTILFYTGITRSASEVLGRRRDNTDGKRAELREMMSLARRLRVVLEGGGRVAEAGELIHEGWLLKKGLAHGISSPSIDEWYERALRAGAWGGKLMGAGGGGYLIFFVPPEKRDRVISELAELEQVPFAFESAGSVAIDW